jgi:hypothetical protein
MIPRDYEYECLLAAANLAHYHPKWGFTILVLVDRWKIFLEGHHFHTSNGTGSFEMDTKKLDINACILGGSAKHRVKVHIIQFGIVNDDSPRKIEMQKDRDGQMIVIPPRLNGLWIKQQSFRQLMEPLVWNYILEKDLEEEEDSSIDKDDSVPSLERKSPSSPPPLIAVSAVAITPVRASSLNNNDMSKIYPNLSHALGDDDGFFDPTNPAVDKSMQGLLKELNHLLSTE